MLGSHPCVALSPAQVRTVYGSSARKAEKDCRKMHCGSITGSILPNIRWPVLRCPSLAGFQVPPEVRGTVPLPARLNSPETTNTDETRLACQSQDAANKTWRGSPSAHIRRSSALSRWKRSLLEDSAGSARPGTTGRWAIRAAPRAADLPVAQWLERLRSSKTRRCHPRTPGSEEAVRCWRFGSWVFYRACPESGSETALTARAGERELCHHFRR